MAASSSVASSTVKGISIAPMMKYTHRHYRFMMRLLTKRTLLYTEMRVDKSVIFGQNLDSMLGFDRQEHPIALQLGGNESDHLCQAAKMGEEYGYDEINLNAGCPSDKVSGKGCFGAALMKDPDHLRQLLYDMKRQVQIPVNVKCRLGVDDLDSYEYVHSFMNSIRDSGVKRVIIHARKCLLKGLSTRDNRSIPPLRYPWVYRLARDFPELDIGINGGIATIDHAHQLLADGHNMYAPGTPLGDGDGEEEIGSDDGSTSSNSIGGVDGGPTRVPLHSVMIGRAAWSNPAMFADVDRRIYGEANPGFNRREIVEQFADYIDDLTDMELKISSGTSGAIAPVVNLFHGCKHSSHIRKAFHTCSRKANGSAEVAASLRAVLRMIPAEVLDEPLAPVEGEIDEERGVAYATDTDDVGLLDSLGSKGIQASV